MGRALEPVRAAIDYGCDVVVLGGTEVDVVGMVVDVVVLVVEVLVVVVDCQCSYEIRSAW